MYTNELKIIRFAIDNQLKSNLSGQDHTDFQNLIDGFNEYGVKVTKNLFFIQVEDGESSFFVIEIRDNKIVIVSGGVMGQVLSSTRGDFGDIVWTYNPLEIL